MPGYLSVRPQDWATIEPTTAARLWAFGNGLAYWDGSAWTTVTLPGGMVFALHLMVAPSNGAVIWAIMVDGDFLGTSFWKSTDSGATWTSLTVPPFFSQNPSHGFVAASATELFAHQGGAGDTVDDPTYGVHRSTDGGATWARIVAPRDNGEGEGELGDDTYGIRVAGGRIFYGEKVNATTFHFVSTDGTGLTDAGPEVYDGLLGYVLCSPAADEGWVYVQGNFDPAFDDGLWFISGTSATDRSPGPDPSGEESQHFYTADDRVDVTIAVHLDETGSPLGTVYRSTDRGSSWTAVDGPSASLQISIQNYPQATHNAAGHFFILASPGGTANVRRSTDDGLTFADIACPLTTVIGMVAGG